MIVARDFPCFEYIEMNCKNCARSSYCHVITTCSVAVTSGKCKCSNPASHDEMLWIPDPKSLELINADLIKDGETVLGSKIEDDFYCSFLNDDAARSIELPENDFNYVLYGVGDVGNDIPKIRAFDDEKPSSFRSFAEEKPSSRKDDDKQFWIIMVILSSLMMMLSLYSFTLQGTVAISTVGLGSSIFFICFALLCSGIFSRGKGKKTSPATKQPRASRFKKNKKKDDKMYLGKDTKMFCRNCMTTFDADGNFCTNCGKKLEKLEHISKTEIERQKKSVDMIKRYAALRPEDFEKEIVKKVRFRFPKRIRGESASDRILRAENALAVIARDLEREKRERVNFVPLKDALKIVGKPEIHIWHNKGTGKITKQILNIEIDNGDEHVDPRNIVLFLKKTMPKE